MDKADETAEEAGGIEEVLGGATAQVKDGLIHLTFPKAVRTRAGTVVLTPVEAKRFRRRLDAAIVDAER